MMMLIEKMLEELEEEVEGAKEYAEKYIECAARHNLPRANKYKDMAMDELNHAANLREFFTADVAEIKHVYPLPEEDQMHWDHVNKHLNEQMAIVRQMLAM